MYSEEVSQSLGVLEGLIRKSSDRIRGVNINSSIRLKDSFPITLKVCGRVEFNSPEHIREVSSNFSDMLGELLNKFFELRFFYVNTKQ
jgi:hypothetical protein